MKKYKVNDKVVYPGFGVVSIKGIEKRGDFKYYILNTSNNMTLIISTGKNNLRDIVKEPSLVYKILKSTPKMNQGTWNKRYRIMTDILKSGSIFGISEVLRDLSYSKKLNDSSFGERKMFDFAKQLFVSEMAIAQNLSENEIETELNRILG